MQVVIIIIFSQNKTRRPFSGGGEFFYPVCRSVRLLEAAVHERLFKLPGVVKLGVGDEEVRPGADLAGIGCGARAPLADDDGDMVVLENAVIHLGPRGAFAADEAVIIRLRPARESAAAERAGVFLVQQITVFTVKHDAAPSRRLFPRPQLFALLFCLAEMLQHGDEQEAGEGCRKAAVIQAERAVQQRDAGDERVMDHAEYDAGQPAVDARNRGQAVCKAEADDDGLCVCHERMFRAGEAADEFRDVACGNIAHHDRPDIGRVAALIAAADHAEHAAQRRGVPLCADKQVVQDDKQPVNAEVQDRRAGAVFRAVVDVVAGIAQEPAVFLRPAERKAPDDGQREHHQTEADADGHEAVCQTDVFRCGRRGGEDLIQKRAQEERNQADGHGCVIKVVALVHLRAVRQDGREEEADKNADSQRKNDAEARKAVPRLAGIAEEHFRDERGKTRGEQEGIRHRTGLFLHGKTVDQNACEREPDVEDCRAPKAEACRQEKREDGHAVRLAAGQAVNPETHGADQRGIQKRSAEAAVAAVKVALDGLAGLRTDAAKARENVRSRPAV